MQIRFGYTNFFILLCNHTSIINKQIFLLIKRGKSNQDWGYTIYFIRFGRIYFFFFPIRATTKIETFGLTVL
jgi:hypothetical protein